MNTQWLETTSDRLTEIGRELSTYLQGLTDPARVRRIRQGLYVVAAIWLIFGMADLVWSLVPQPRVSGPPEDIINPLVEPAQQGARDEVNIDALVGWNLFGTAAQAPAPVVEEPEQNAAADELDGIEANAKETRLALDLKGIVASSDPSVARAIIESKKKQEQYMVGDDLPVGNRVKLAKILADRVVIDNAGKYELLLLFDKNDLAESRRSTLSVPEDDDEDQVANTRRRAATSRMDRRGNRDVTKLAESYRQRLYSNPQSLAQVVRIAAVRSDGQLTGYRVSAGRDKEQFEALGFQAGDVVTGVNGIELTDPGKAVELYRVMRQAEEASFSVLRNGEEVNLVVGLGAASAGEAAGRPTQSPKED